MGLSERWHVFFTGSALAASSSRTEVLHAAVGLSGAGHGRLCLPPGPVEQFDFCQAFAYHGGKEQGKEYTADQHVVVVIL